MVSIPITPCNCITVDSAAIACALLSCVVYMRRELRRLRQHQLLNPRDASIPLQRAADAVIICDVVKVALGLVVVHGFLFVHEAIVSNGGRNETRYFFVVHLARSCVDVAVVSAVAQLVWSCVVIRYVNYLIANGQVDDRRTVFFAALRASGRYNSSYGLNWENADSMDLRIDADAVPPSQTALEPSVLHHRVERRIVEEDREQAEEHRRRNEEDEDDDDDPTSHLQRRPTNPYEPIMAWWRCQTIVWCALLFMVAALLVGVQLVWRELLGTNDPMLYALTKFSDAVDGNGDFVCSGEQNGQEMLPVGNGQPSMVVVVLSWIAVLLFHFIIAFGCLIVLHRKQKYTGRTMHVAHADV